MALGPSANARRTLVSLRSLVGGPTIHGMAEYFDRVRKLSALLFVVGVCLVFATILTPSALPVQRTPVYALLVAALIAGLAVRLFPWRRFHPNLFLVVGAVATAMIALLI